MAAAPGMPAAPAGPTVPAPSPLTALLLHPPGLSRDGPLFRASGPLGPLRRRRLEAARYILAVLCCGFATAAWALLERSPGTRACDIFAPLPCAFMYALAVLSVLAPLVLAAAHAPALYTRPAIPLAAESVANVVLGLLWSCASVFVDPGQTPQLLKAWACMTATVLAHLASSFVAGLQVYRRGNVPPVMPVEEAVFTLLCR